MSFEKIFSKSKIILTEGAYVERLKAEFEVELDPHLNHSGLIYTNPEIMELLYRQYADIGQKYSLPIMLMTPTRKVNSNSLSKSLFSNKNLIHDSCLFLNKIKDSYEAYSQNIMLGGFLGCKGDAYTSEDAMGIEESYEFHRIQISQFEKENIDFLYAGLMPEINEALGMSKALALTKIPYIISFMIRKDGCLIDGTSISDAIKIIDTEVNPKPICYMTNCVHPTNLRLALSHDKNKNQPQLSRFKGIQANASTLGPEELNNCGILQEGDFDVMIEEMLFLYEKYDLKVFGGCCGTNDKFIEDLSLKMKDIT